MYLSDFSPSSPRSLRSFFGSSQSGHEETVFLPDYYRLTRQESYGPRFEADEEAEEQLTEQIPLDDKYNDWRQNSTVQLDIDSLSRSTKNSEDDENCDFDSASYHSHSKSLITFCDYDLERHEASNPIPNPSAIVTENKSKSPSLSLMSLRAIVLSFFRLQKGHKSTA